MIYNFNVDTENHAKAALILYALYKSRSPESSINGKETWERMKNYSKGALLKASNIAEFIEQFSKKADVKSIKPIYLKTDGLVKIDDNTLAEIEGVYNYQLDIFADNDKEILKLIENETMFLILIVRDRIQREKELFNNVDEN